MTSFQGGAFKVQRGGTATFFSFNSVLHKDLTTKTSAGNLSVQGGTYTQGTTMAQVLGLAPSGVAAGSNDTSNVFITNGTMNFSAFGGTSTDESKGYQNMIKLVQNAIVAMTNVTSTLGAAENNALKITCWQNSRKTLRIANHVKA